MSRIAIMVLITIMTCGGCARLTGGGGETTGGTAAADMVSKADTLAKAGKYSDAIEAYKTVVQEHQNTAWAATAQYESAMAYLAADNPQRDYAQALARLDEFISQNPKHERAADARNWRLAIKTMLDLKRENDRLNKNIERLKQLDMRQEEKRMGR